MMAAKPTVESCATLYFFPLQFAIAAMVPSALVFSLGDEALYEILNRMEIAIQELDSRSLPVPGSLQEFMDEGNAGTLASGGVVFGIAMIAFTYHASVIPVRLHVTCINDFPNSFLCMVSACMLEVLGAIYSAQLLFTT